MYFDIVIFENYIDCRHLMQFFLQWFSYYNKYLNTKILKLIGNRPSGTHYSLMV